MRRVLILAAVGAAIAATTPMSNAATLPGCAAANPGKPSCTFKILQSSNIPAGVAATTTWTIKNSAGVVVYQGKAGRTNIIFKAGNYTLTATGKGAVGAGKPQASAK